MTKRLYYEDSYLQQFAGTVLDQTRIDQKPAVVLDQTAFYPESGGQPCDTGMLQDARVLSVLEDDTGSILHILDRELSGKQVSGQIDWARRFDHMQQHTGQHILSQAFLSVAQARTLSFHMGTETSTIDIELAHTSASQIEEAQALAANIVFENRPIHILTTDREHLSSLGVRKDPRREGDIRVIDIGGFDRSACGGTHVRNTGEIGIIFISGSERYKGGTRIEFVAGRRALKILHKNHELLKSLGRFYSSAAEDLPALAEKMSEERISLMRENDLLRDALLDLEAERLLQDASDMGNGSIISRTFSDRKLDAIKALAQKLTARPGVIAILGLTDACQVVIARSRDLPGNCGEAIKRAASELGGKGGGRPELAQAGGFSGDSVDRWMRTLEAYFKSVI
jgi:alanyl-tRNA synthetase